MSLDPQTFPLPLGEPTPEGFEDPRFWLDTQGLADLAGINRWNANNSLKRCHTGSTWRKTALRVRMVDSVGGNSGKAYQVFAPSLPSELAAAWKAAHPDLFRKEDVNKLIKPVSAENRITESSARRRGAIIKGEFIEALIKPALIHPKRSPARAEAARKLCAESITFPNGKTKTYDLKGITRLISKYERGGISALIRAPRTEKPTRVIVSRDFDKTAPFTDAEKEEIWVELRQFIKDQFLGTHNTIPGIEGFANVKLVELCRAKGWAGASLQNCHVGIAQVRKFKYLRIAAAKTLDAGKYADHFKLRVMRGRKGLEPMEIVMGDVHPVDIITLREDESEATARMVAWLDLATNRVFYTLFLFEKGKTITQTHIAYSFVQMVRAWGLPSILYLDNGSEYIWKEMMDGFSRLSMMVREFHDFRAYCMEPADLEQRIQQADNEDLATDDTPRAVVRSIPHNPTGKAPIEGLFGVLERTVFCLIPGWIGGDRMNKKTHKVGKRPRAFKGTFQQFEAAFATAIDYHHAKAQRDGSSPNEKFNRHAKAGWCGADVDYEVLIMALAERKPYKVLNTGIEISGVTYWHDVMAQTHVMGNKVLVYYAKWDTDQIVVLPRDPVTGRLADPVIAYRAREFGIVDKSGAIESGRRQSLMNKSIRDAKQGSRPVDAVAEMAKYVQLSTPATAVTFGPKITLPEEFKGIREAVTQAGEPPKVEKVRLLPGQWIDKATGEIRCMYTRTEAPKAAPVEDWESEERARLIQKAREAEARATAEKNGSSDSRLTNHN